MAGPMYVEDPKKLYACFRCGEIGGDVKEVNGKYHCGSCGENGLVTFIQALDYLNHMYLTGHLIRDGMEEDDEYEIILPEDEES